MSIDVKICGLSNSQTMRAALDAGADFIGLVFFYKSPRNVALELASGLAEDARGKAKIVALTVNEHAQGLLQIAENVQPDFVQAHGTESPEQIRKIEKICKCPVIKAIKVKTAADIQLANAYKEVCPFVIFDAKAPETDTSLPGGNGISFDWTLVRDANIDMPYMLSGGLDIGNIREAIEITGAKMIDVSSGVETAPGKKDAKLIREFIRAAKSG